MAFIRKIKQLEEDNNRMWNANKLLWELISKEVSDMDNANDIKSLIILGINATRILYYANIFPDDITYAAYPDSMSQAINGIKNETVRQEVDEYFYIKEYDEYDFDSFTPNKDNIEEDFSVFDFLDWAFGQMNIEGGK